MVVSINPCLAPIAVGVSIKHYIKECLAVIKEYKLGYEFGQISTEIE